LQELMILEQSMQEIRPDLVILQFCTNDFINNSVELETLSRINNCGLRRPYLNSQGDVFYALPKRSGLLRHFANHYSQCLYFIFSRLDRLAVGGEDTVERGIAVARGKQ